MRRDKREASQEKTLIEETEVRQNFLRSVTAGQKPNPVNSP